MMPGRDLDALVAEHIMGYHREIDLTHDYDRKQHKNEVLLPPGQSLESMRDFLPRKGQIPFGYFVNERYSTDIAAAWQVVERFRRLNYDVALHTTAADGWVCAFRGALLADAMQAATPAHAICLAALRACGVEVEA